MKGPVRSPAIRRGIERARRAGYEVRFEPFVSLAGIPESWPGCIAGVCDYKGKRIVVSTHRSWQQERAALARGRHKR